MGRRSHSRALGVWTNGLHVGRWLIPANGPMEFSYDPAWVSSPQARPLSLSLPINLDGIPIKGEKIGFFFDNLLPDNDSIRRRIQSRFQTRSGDAFDLLEAVGRDCVGAIQLLPEGKTPEGVFEIRATPLADEEIERLLRGAVSDSNPFEGQDGDFRISIAGAQEKTALTWHNERWCKPHGATPTTHILKHPLGLVGGRQLDMSTSLENEWLCAQILAGYGVPIAPCQRKRFGDKKTLIVTRFDRRLHSSGQYWLRLPQEDFCQATGTPGAKKYENEGGPGLTTIARILNASVSPEKDLDTLLRAQFLFWMLAAIDGHAKNFSIRLLPQGRYELTPLYDVLSAWPITGSRYNQIQPKKLKLAMALRGDTTHYHITEIQRRHFNMTAKHCGLGNDMEAIITDVIGKTPSVIKKVESKLPSDFPGDLVDSIMAGLKRSARRIETMPPT